VLASLLAAALPALALTVTAFAGNGAGVLVAIAASAGLIAAGVGAPAIAAMWTMVLLTAWQRRRLAKALRLSSLANASEREQGRGLQKDVDFYAERARTLSARGQTRRQLSRAARDLGGLLDAGEIHARLIGITREVFPGSEVVLLPGEAAAGAGHQMAAPLRVARNVIGTLRVSSANGAFSNDDRRLLEVLSSLAADAMENGRLFDQVQQNALRDGLTGLLNHKAFQGRLEDAVLEASRYRQPMSVILIDLDHFKTVNDTHGHPAGDAVLQGVSHVLDRHARDVDVVARYGGEEFVILLFQTGYAEAAAMAERIRHDLSEQALDAGGRTLYATASFGVASFPEDATSAQQLMRQADQRLYGAKKAGRNRVGERS